MSAKVTSTPTVRWGGIIWGTLFLLAAAAGIVVLAVPDPDEVVGWLRPVLFQLRPEWLGASLPLGLGILAIVLGAAFVLRRGRRVDEDTVTAAEDEPQEAAAEDERQEAAAGQ